MGRLRSERKWERRCFLRRRCGRSTAAVARMMLLYRGCPLGFEHILMFIKICRIQRGLLLARSCLLRLRRILRWLSWRRGGFGLASKLLHHIDKVLFYLGVCSLQLSLTDGEIFNQIVLVVSILRLDYLPLSCF